jgi:hypothetical protein
VQNRLGGARARDRGHGICDLRELVGAQLDVRRGDVLLQTRAALGPGDRDDVVALGQHPCKRELRRRHALGGGELLDRGDEVEVALEVLALEARVPAAEVVVGEVVERLDLAGQEPAAERRVGHEADAELAAGRQDLVLGVARPQRVLGLQRGDLVHGVRAAQRLGSGLAQAEVADLALRDQLGHRPDGLLDRRVDVDAVLVVEVDVVGAEALQRVLARLLDVLGAPVGGAAARVGGIADDPELRGQHDLVAAIGDRAPDEALVCVRAVDVGGVEEVDAQLDGAMDHGDRLVVVARAVELGHAHAAQAEGGDGGAGAAQRACLHARHAIAPY